MNTKKILQRMKEKGVTQKEVAEVLGLARSTVSQKLRDVRPMFLDEAEKLSKLLEIDDSDFGKYFFRNNVA